MSFFRVVSSPTKGHHCAMSSTPSGEVEEKLTVAAVARRIGVAPATLRTWDRRYGLGPSEHIEGEHRRYCPSDLAKLTMMRRLIVAGVAPADAAEQAREFKGQVKLAKIVKDIEAYLVKLRGHDHVENPLGTDDLRELQNFKENLIIHRNTYSDYVNSFIFYIIYKRWFFYYKIN